MPKKEQTFVSPSENVTMKYPWKLEENSPGKPWKSFKEYSWPPCTLKWLRWYSNCSPWLEKFLNINTLKWLKLHSNCD